MAFKNNFPHAELIIVTPTNFLKLTDLIEGPCGILCLQSNATPISIRTMLWNLRLVI